MTTPKPTLIVWKTLLRRYHPLRSLLRLGKYFVRRYPDQLAESEVGQLTAFTRDVDASGSTYSSQSTFAGVWPPLWYRSGYSLSAPLERLHPFDVPLLCCGGHTTIHARVLPGTGALRGLDFEVRDVIGDDLIGDEVAREHAEALIHLLDNP